jgi:hypothetical protein
MNNALILIGFAFAGAAAAGAIIAVMLYDQGDQDAD